MLNNFIYAKTKALFEEQLNNGNILNEAIVFIEDTKEIWNHGHYFAGESIDPELLEQIQTSVQELKASIDDNPFEKGDVENSAALKGGNNQTTSECEVALGKYNASNYDTHFSIGIGTSEDDRKNAFEVKQNGDIYIEGVEGRIQDKLDKLVEITYLELKSLRNDSKLLPGQQYRITDYVTTTVQENTRIAEEYHPFDIIVIADDINVLNENARAIQHEEDTYFASSDLNAWEVKYCLDNDTDRFVWADATNGKGVIYYMKDEFNNECSYDFKNIQFRHPKDTDTYPDYYYTFTWIDENYDIMDTSIFGNNGTLSCYGEIYGVYSNVIKPYMGVIYDEDSEEYLGTKQLLNSIIFISDYKYEGGNDGFFGCYDNSFGSNCYRNSFGNDCSLNSFGNYCRYNSFGDDCYRNSFGNYCYDNSFGNGCYDNSFGNGCSRNSFGEYCYRNSFGNNCYDNSFGNDCSHNSFGNDCYDNSFGNNCYGNSFGEYCRHNSFGESSSNPKSYYCYIIFDNGNSYINLNCTSTTSSSKYYQNVRIGLGVNNIDTDTYKTINDSNVGQTYETCYKPANSQTITI